jgi:hypothetical protein
MKFGQPLITTELSGSMGGAVASSSRGGVGYFRRRAIPGNPRTLGQTTMRTILAGITAAWVSTLTALQRSGWETISPPESSGIDSYVKGNSLVLLGGDARVDAPPAALSFPSNPITTTPVYDASADTIVFIIPALNTGRTAVFCSAPQSASRAARQSNFLFVAATVEDAVGSQTINVPATHPAFAAVAGQVVYVRTVNYDNDTGQVSIGQEFRVTVVA